MSVDLDRLTAPFPRQAIQQRQGGGGKALSYLETHTVIHRLNDATGNCWDFRLTKLEQIGDLFIATGELTLPGCGTRTGIGVQRVSERGGEDLVKGASSDALKKAATLFGVGLELYGPDYEAREIAQPRANTPETRPNGPGATNGADLATEKQIKFLWALARDKNVSDDDLKAHLWQRYERDSTRALTKNQASEVIDWLNGAPPSPVASFQRIHEREIPEGVPGADGDPNAWTTVWKELKAFGVAPGNVIEGTALLGFWDTANPARIVTALRELAATMPAPSGTAGNDRHTQ